MSTFGSNQIKFNIPLSQQDKLKFFEDEVEQNYIASDKNKHPFGVFSDNDEESAYFSDSYNYSELIGDDKYLNFDSGERSDQSQVTSSITQSSSNTGSLRSDVNIIITQQDILAFNEDSITPQYIAPYRNKHIFGVLPYNQTNSFYYSPNYEYGTDHIHEEQQVIKTGGADFKLLWLPM